MDTGYIYLKWIEAVLEPINAQQKIPTTTEGREIIVRICLLIYYVRMSLLYWIFCLIPLMPPLEKGGILFCNWLSVGMSVGPSVDQVLFVQYLLTPSLDQYQTWDRGCPQWVDDPYWFSGHMFKGQGQPIFSAHCVVRSISFDPFTWLIPNLVQGLRPVSR